jgi:hypothetical protein
MSSRGFYLSPSGGGSGGGILLAADTINVSGTVSAAGGIGGDNSSAESGGIGLIKILWGSAHSITGTLAGEVIQSVLPPIPVTSTSNPDPTLVYNDGLSTVLFSWTKPFPSAQGYFVYLDTTASNPPTAVTGQLLSTDYTSFPATALVGGANYFHIVSVNPASNVGTVETVFEIQINATPPAITCSTHPNQAAWYTNANPDLAWTFPQGNANVVGAYYLVDHDGLTVPTPAATFIPVSQQQLLLTGVQPGVWVFHIVSKDRVGNLTQHAGHYRVNVGTDPGSGSLVGTVVDGSGTAVSGGSVSVNNGLYAQSTNSSGQYNIATMTAGTWTVTASANGHSTSASATVTSGGVTKQNFVVQ